LNYAFWFPEVAAAIRMKNLGKYGYIYKRCVEVNMGTAGEQVGSMSKDKKETNSNNKIKK
jgi:hypothetical protein